MGRVPRQDDPIPQQHLHGDQRPHPQDQGLERREQLVYVLSQKPELQGYQKLVDFLLELRVFIPRENQLG